jgi:hypothetical protein
MTRLKAIEKAILQLTAEELARLRDWLDEFEGRLLDAMIERAADSGGRGKVPKLTAEALAKHEAGSSRQL